MASANKFPFKGIAHPKILSFCQWQNFHLLNPSHRWRLWRVTWVRRGRSTPWRWSNCTLPWPSWRKTCRICVWDMQRQIRRTTSSSWRIKQNLEMEDRKPTGGCWRGRETWVQEIPAVLPTMKICHCSRHRNVLLVSLLLFFVTLIWLSEILAA